MPSGPESSSTRDVANQRPTVAGLPYRWVAMGVVLFGTFMVVLDTTIVNLGLSELRDDFDTSTGVEWVVTAYLIAVGVSQLTSGWLGDKYGRPAMFIVALAVFTVASLLCAIAPTLFTLVAARVLQGIGGGLLLPVGMAMVYELFEPAERGKALGYFGIAVMAAPAIGPILGGSVVTSVGWRWLFLINVPIGVVGIAVALRKLRDTGFRKARPFDGIGLALAVVGLVSLLVGFQQGGAWGWTSLPIVGLLAVGAVLMSIFARYSAGREHALVDVSIFVNPIFARSMFAIALMTVAQYCRLVYIPLELGGARDIDELTVGFVMLPSALGVAAMMPLGGRLTDRLGSKIPFTLGCTILMSTYWPLSHLSADTGLTRIAVVLFVGGIGTGLAVMSPNVVAMNSVRATQVGDASGLSQVSRQLSAGMGTAVLASVFATARDDAAATGDIIAPYNTVFTVALFLLAGAVLVGLTLPGKRLAAQLQADRLAEQRELIAAGAISADDPPPTIDH